MLFLGTQHHLLSTCALPYSRLFPWGANLHCSCGCQTFLPTKFSTHTVQQHCLHLLKFGLVTFCNGSFSLLAPCCRRGSLSGKINTEAVHQSSYTVKPSNKGHIGDGPFVPCREVVPFSEPHEGIIFNGKMARCHYIRMMQLQL